jgi:hypothetical protein
VRGRGYRLLAEVEPIAGGGFCGDEAGMGRRAAVEISAGAVEAHHGNRGRSGKNAPAADSGFAIAHAALG